MMDNFAMNGEDSAEEWAGGPSRGDEGVEKRGSLVGKIEMGVDDPSFVLPLSRELPLHQERDEKMKWTYEAGLGVEKSCKEGILGP